ncbi:TetR-like C-terminal domain-containing protein [Ureibacillus sp. FSL K6-3587]|uniref:TetR/AcrR family transcriptional regulator n=1 Tax=Ureibacillus sp. FSL K6-3587 TaxID=2954681 RepID=UPI00315801A4
MKLDPRQAKSKEKLHSAYLSLMKDGNVQLTIQQICKEAGLTRPTFYKLYNDINELRRDLFNHLLLQLKEALTIQSPKPLKEMPKEEMPRNLFLLFEHIQNHRIAYETFLIHQPDALFIQGILDILKRYVEEGIHYTETRQYLLSENEELIISYIAGAYLESIRWWITTNYKCTPNEMAATLIELSINGPYIKRFN